jgi:hypothetical protein
MGRGRGRGERRMPASWREPSSEPGSQDTNKNLVLVENGVRIQIEIIWVWNSVITIALTSLHRLQSYLPRQDLSPPLPPPPKKPPSVRGLFFSKPRKVHPLTERMLLFPSY